MINVCAHLEWHIAVGQQRDVQERDVWPGDGGSGGGDGDDDDADRSNRTYSRNDYYVLLLLCVEIIHGKLLGAFLVEL